MVDLAVSYVKVRVGKGKGKGKDQDDGKGEGKKGKDKDSEKALVVEVALAGGTSGAQAHELLARVFRKLYKVHREGVRKPVFSSSPSKRTTAAAKTGPCATKCARPSASQRAVARGRGRRGRTLQAPPPQPGAQPSARALSLRDAEALWSTAGPGHAESERA